MRRRRLEGTRRQWVEKMLLSGKAVSNTDLIAACGGQGGWRLGAYIHALAKDKEEPWPILRAYSGNQRMATYQLEKGFRPGGPLQLGLPL